jgi:uracil phosphoribosyltransferase
MHTPHMCRTHAVHTGTPHSPRSHVAHRHKQVYSHPTTLIPTPHRLRPHPTRPPRLLAEEGLARLPSNRPVTVTTPCGTYQGLRVPPPSDIVVVSIVRAGEAGHGYPCRHAVWECFPTVRMAGWATDPPPSLLHVRDWSPRPQPSPCAGACAGDSLLDAVKRAMPGVSVGKILIQRDEEHPLKLPHVSTMRCALPEGEEGGGITRHRSHDKPLYTGGGLAPTTSPPLFVSCTTASCPRTSPPST